MRSRKQRREDPDQWWELVESVDENQQTIEENGHTIYLKGKVGNVTVAQIATGSPGQMTAAMQAAQQAMKTMGIESGLVVTDAIRFMRLRPVDPEKAKRLEAKRRAQQPPTPTTH